MTYALAIKRRAQLIEARAVLAEARKGTTYLDKELVSVTAWLVNYANKQDRKAARAA